MATKKKPMKKKVPIFIPNYVLAGEVDPLADGPSWAWHWEDVPPSPISKAIGELTVTEAMEFMKTPSPLLEAVKAKNSSMKVLAGKDALMLDSGIILCGSGHLLRKCHDDCHYCDYEKSPDDYSDDEGNKYRHCVYKGGSKQFVCDVCKQHFTVKESIPLKINNNLPKFCGGCRDVLMVGHLNGHTYTSAVCFDCNTIYTGGTSYLFLSKALKEAFTPIKQLPNSSEVINESGEVMPIQPKATPPEKKEPQNFYVVLEIDGRKNVIQAGPNAKKGGFKLSVFQRDSGEPTQVLDIRGLVNEFDDTLKLSTLVTSDQLPLFNIKTQR